MCVLFLPSRQAYPITINLFKIQLHWTLLLESIPRITKNLEMFMAGFYIDNARIYTVRRRGVRAGLHMPVRVAF
jgi:hypothetical protein